MLKLVTRTDKSQQREVVGVGPSKMRTFVALCMAATGLAQQANGQTQPEEKPQTLRVATWGGAYGAAQKNTILTPAGKVLKVEIERIPSILGRPAVREADVLEVSQADLISGCADGSLARLESVNLKPGKQGETAASDFVAGGLSDCGVASFAWSSLFLVNRAKFKKRIPRNLGDVFDTKRFPGKRVIIKRAENLFEFLAVANGAQSSVVYEDLADREDLDAVVARLERLLPHILWVDTPNQALDALRSGKASIAMGYSGRAFRTTIAGGMSALWDVHIFNFSSWVVSAKAREPELGKSFIALATSPDYLAAQSRLWPYGPMRKSAAAMVGKHSLLDVTLEPYMPTSSLRLGGGIRFNAGFWAANSEKLNDRITALLEGFRRGVRVPPPSRRPKQPAPSVATDSDASGRAN